MAISFSFFKLRSTQNAIEILRKRLTISGFLVLELLPMYGAKFFAEVAPLLEKGVITSKEHVVEGIDNAIQALIDTSKGGGESIGKPVVVVAEP